MVDVLGTDIPINMPKLQVNTLTIILILIIVFALAFGILGVWLLVRWKTYNKKIVVFENIAGRGFQPVYKDKARLVKIGNSGEELLFLKKKKVYRSAYGKKMGKNTYWYAVGQDGYWYNVVLGDVDAKMGMLDIEPTNTSARFEYTAMAQNIERNYTKKPSVMDKYGTYIISGIFLIIVGVIFIVVINKMNMISQSVAEAVKTAALVQDKTGQILSSLDNICSRGGGITPVG